MKKFSHTITTEDQIKEGGVVLNHSLGTEDVVVQLWHPSGNENEATRSSFTITNLDENRIRLFFHGDDGEGWRVVVIG